MPWCRTDDVGHLRQGVYQFFSPARDLTAHRAYRSVCCLNNVSAFLAGSAHQDVCLGRHFFSDKRYAWVSASVTFGQVGTRETS